MYGYRAEGVELHERSSHARGSFGKAFVRAYFSFPIKRCNVHPLEFRIYEESRRKRAATDRRLSQTYLLLASTWIHYSVYISRDSSRIFRGNLKIMGKPRQSFDF